jgi:serine/threonine protein kinase
MFECIDPNIMPLLGWRTNAESTCLVYALTPGGSLKDCLMCCENSVPLASKERILVLSDVLRGLAYLNAEVSVIHCDVKSAMCSSTTAEFVESATSAKLDQSVTSAVLLPQIFRCRLRWEQPST